MACESCVMKVSLFGPFDCALNGQSIDLAPRSKRLLALVIISGVLNKPSLAELLWPVSDRKQARTNLRRELHILFQSLPAQLNGISHNRERIYWKTPEGLVLDIEHFEREYTRFNENRTGHRISAALALLACYKGALLEGLSDEVFDSHRKRFSDRYDQVADYVVCTQMGAEDYAQALEVLRRWRQFNALHEGAVILELKILCKLGRLSESIDLYARFSEKLKAELGCEPGEKLRALASTLFVPLSTNIEKTKQPLNLTSKPPVFIGREAELQLLSGLYSDFRFPMVLISGESGIGKSSLVDKWVKKHSQHIRCVRIRGQYSDKNSPFSALSQWLARPAVQQHIKSLNPAHRNELAGVFPEYFSVGKPVSIPAEPLSESLRIRARLFDALSRLVVIGEKDTLLFVDDLQWVDMDSLLWLLSWINLPHQRLAVIATVRTPEYQQEKSLYEHILQLAAEGKCYRLQLAPLSMPERLLAMQHLLETGVFYTEQINKLCEASGGNPLFLTELSESARASRNASGYSELPLYTDRIHAIIKKRLSILTEQQKSLTVTAAIVGRKTDATVLALASDVKINDAIDALEDLVAQHVLIADVDSNYEFRHDCLREALLTDISAVRKRFVHQRIAIAYQKLNVFRPDTVAYHYDFAGLSEDAIEWYARSVQYAERRHAFQECLRFCDKAINYFGTLKADEVLLVQLIDVLLAKSRVAALLYGMTSKLVEDSCRELDTKLIAISDTGVQLKVLDRLRKFAMHSGDLVAATRYSRKMLQTIKEDDSAELRVEAHRSYGLSLLVRGLYSAGRKSLKTAVKIGKADHSESADSPYYRYWSLTMSQYMFSHITAVTGRIQESQLALSEGRENQNPHYDTVSRIYLYFAQACALQHYRDTESMLELVQQMHDLNCSVSNTKLACFAYAFGGWANGDAKAGVAEIEKALRLYNQITDLHCYSHWYLLHAERLIELGKPDKALKSIRMGLDMANTKCGSYLGAELHRLYGLAWFDQYGDVAESIVHMEKSIALSAKQGAHLFNLRSQRDRILLYVTAGLSVSDAWVAELRVITHKIGQWGNCVDLHESTALLQKVEQEKIR